MASTRARQVALQLFDARKSSTVLSSLPELSLNLGKGASDAHEAQRELVNLLTGTSGGIIGYKIGCTSPAAQKNVGFTEPVRGFLMSNYALKAQPGLAIRADSLCPLKLAEPEYAFEIGLNLQPRTDYTKESIASAVRRIRPSIEVATTAIEDIAAAGPAALIADNAGHGYWVFGKPYPKKPKGPSGEEDDSNQWHQGGDWKAIDILDHIVELRKNGELVSSGSGRLVLEHPLNALAWLANDLGRKDLALKEGDIVSTGACTDPLIAVEAGDVIEAHFGDALGSVRVKFT